MRELSAKTIVSIASLGAVSYFVVSVDSSGVIQAARAQQSNLPPVTIVAPKPKAQQSAKRSRTRTASPVQRRVAATRAARDGACPLRGAFNWYGRHRAARLRRWPGCNRRKPWNARQPQRDGHAVQSDELYC